MLITKPQQISVQMHYQVYTNNRFMGGKKTFTAFLDGITRNVKAVQCILNPNKDKEYLIIRRKKIYFT